jgi:hypothetical protein
VKYQPLIGTALSGSIGGVTASHNTYGGYFRKKVKPVNKKTAPQQAQRQNFATISKSWRLLTAAQQAAWNATPETKTTRKGTSVALTGAASFAYVNVIRQAIGLPIINDPPTGGLPPGFTPPTVALDPVAGISLTFAADGWNTDAGGVAISLAGPIPPGRTFSRKFTTLCQLANPGTTTVVTKSPVSISGGQTYRLRFHTSDPAGRQALPADLDVLYPASLNVLRVVYLSVSSALWYFDRAVNVTTPGAADTGLQIGELQPTAINPTDDPTAIQATYGLNAPGATWIAAATHSNLTAAALPDTFTAATGTELDA